MAKLLKMRRPRRGQPARQPFTIDLHGDWQRCTKTLPRQSSILGTVTSEGVTGALARLHSTNSFIKIVDGHVSVLNSIKVQQALTTFKDHERQSTLEMVEIDAWLEGQPKQ